MASRVSGLLKGTRALMAAARATTATPKSSTVAAEAPPLVFEINISLTVHSNGQVTSSQIPPKKLSVDFDRDSGAAAIVASPPQNRKSENDEDDVDEEKKELVENVIKPDPKDGEEIDKAEKVESPTRRRPGDMQKALRLSPELSGFLGVPEASRNHAFKQVWDHIKLHNLQTQEDWMVVVCDDKLKTIFEGKDKIRFYEIQKLMTHHFVKDESPTRRRPGDMQKALRLSPELSGFLGVPEASYSHALKQVWDHIKLHNLQTQEDRMVVVCDDKLKTIFEGKDKIPYHEIQKLMTHHFVKAD